MAESLHKLVNLALAANEVRNRCAELVEGWCERKLLNLYPDDGALVVLKACGGVSSFSSSSTETPPSRRVALMRAMFARASAMPVAVCGGARMTPP